MATSGPPQERNQAATAFVGDLDARVTDSLLWELMLQAGPVVNVYIPKDKLTGDHMGYGFVEFAGEEDCEYAIKVMNMISLFGRPIRVNPASRTTLDVGANLFIGNLDEEVDEKLLYDTFSAFGVIVKTPKIMRDPDTGKSRGFGFVSFDCFEASDAVIEAMNGQYLCNRPINVQYALKKSSKSERHGDQAERFLAAKMRAVRGIQPQQQRPHTMFGTGPSASGGVPAGGGPGQMMGGMPPPGMRGMMPPGYAPPNSMGLQPPPQMMMMAPNAPPPPNPPMFLPQGGPPGMMGGPGMMMPPQPPHPMMHAPPGYGGQAPPPGWYPYPPPGQQQ